MFKGGTCVKKCFFETYRFSEDLDFSARPDAPYTSADILGQLRELTAHVSELSGLEFASDLVSIKLRQNKQGQTTFEGRVAYRGPLAYPGTPKIRFDITQHEAILETPAERPILHPYPDHLPMGSVVLTYPFEELLAEKTRALLERSRPRDLYDVVHLIENAPADLNLVVVRDLFARKCKSKDILAPSAAQLLEVVSTDVELRSEWDSMLAHQLPALPSLDDLLSRLPSVLTWIDVPSDRVAARQLPTVEGPGAVVDPGIRYWGAGSPLETIRFAATNRLMIAFDYHGRRRVVEPYSVRQAGTGNILLYAWELHAGHIKAFKLDEMIGTEALTTPFSPRYQIDISGVIPTAPPRQSPPVRSPSPARSRSQAREPSFEFRCPNCGKNFRHRRNVGRLRAHKDKSGGPCPGRHGYYVGTHY